LNNFQPPGDARQDPRKWGVPGHLPEVILLLAAITFAGGWLRFYAITEKSVWLDEAFSIWMAWHRPGELLGLLVRIDQHPPLYYLLLALWQRLFGDLQGTVRSLSALFSTLTIPIIFLITKRVTRDQITALLAALLLAVAPFHVRFAQETRMYALLTLAAALAIFFAVALLQQEDSSPIRGNRSPPGPQFWGRQLTIPPRVGGLRGQGVNSPIRAHFWWSPRQWRAHPAMRYAIGLAIAQAAVMLTHNTAAIFFPLALNLPVLGALLHRRRTGCALSMPRANQPGFLGEWLQVQIVALLLWSPWAIAFVRQSLAVDQQFWIPAPDAPRLWSSVTALLIAHLPDWMPAAPWALGMLGLALFGAWSLRSQGAWAAFFLSLWLTPIAGELLVSLHRPIFYDRTLIWTTLALFTLVATGIRAIGVRTARTSSNPAASTSPHPWAKLMQAIVALLLVAGSGLAIDNYYHYFEKEGWDQAAAFVAEAADEEDLILFNATWVQIPFEYYFRRYFPEYGAQNDLRGAPSDLFESGQLEPRMTPADLPRLRELIADRERVWLVYSHDWYTDPDQLIPAELGQSLEQTDEEQFAGLRVLRYERGTVGE